MSGEQEKPVPGKEKVKESGTTTTSSTLSSDEASNIQKTLDPEIAAGIKSQFGQYLASTGKFGEDLANWEAAGFSPDQLAGFAASRAAVGPGGAIPASIEELLATARGDYLTGPGRDEQLAAIQRSLMPDVLSRFGAAGRGDNFLGRENLARSVADSYLMNVFNPERGRMLQASQMIPGQALLPGQTLQDIGRQYQELEQYGRNFPLSQYPALLAAFGGALPFADPFSGQTSTASRDVVQHGTTTEDMLRQGTSTPAYFPGSQSAGVLGGALAGASAGSAFGPWGAGIGAVGGGLLGLA